MRWSKYFLQTVREVPGDAEAVSHVLLTRAGMMRRIAAGIYALTPLGLRSHRKTEAIVREEMNRAGALELEVPILQPRELWEESGRWARYSSEQILFHLRDRKEGDYCLAPTAEEAVTSLVRAGVTSYRQIFERCGLDFTVVEADPGAIGGSDSQEFMVLAETGEDSVVRCVACGYGANVEKAETGRRPSAWDGESAGALEDVETPGRGGIDEVVEFLGITPSRMIKCLVYDTEKGPAVGVL